MSPDEDVRLRWTGDIARIEFGNPATGNALTWDLGARLRWTVESVAQRASCIVLSTPGRVFCAGADLEMLRELASPDKAGDVRERVYGVFQALISAVSDSPAPVITRVQGPALGAGVDLLLASDIRVASDRAWLEESWIRLGVIAALGAAETLATLVGRGTALDLLLTARRVKADEALRLGLLQRVVAPEDLDAEVDGVAGRISEADRDAVRAMKRLVTSSDSLAAGLALALEEQVPLIARPGFATRIDAVRDSIRKDDARRGQT